jgi:diaminopimelate decarboxylase
MILENNVYSIQGLAATALADDFGTPLYVYDADKIVSQINRLKNAYSATDVKIKYACKAATNVSILKLVRKHGVGVEAVSLGEVAIALKAGFTPPEITFTPSGVAFEEIELGQSIGACQVWRKI